MQRVELDDGAAHAMTADCRRESRALPCSRAAACAILAAAVTALPLPSAAQTLPDPRAVSDPQAVPDPKAPAATADSTEIVVTAQKRSEVISKVPMSITALTGDALAEKGIQNIADLAKAVPGLSYVDSGSSTPIFSLRGVGFFDTALGARPAVTTYLDEVPLPFAAMALGANMDLSRVEVLKGPQGTLYGQNSTGGAINFIAARPTEDFHAGISGTLGRFLDSDTQGYVSGSIAPGLTARLSGRIERSKGWQYSLSRDDSLGAKRFMEGRLLVDWRVSDALTARFSYNGFKDDSDTQAQQRIAFLPQTASRVVYLYGTPNFTAPPRDDRAADWDPGLNLRRHNAFNQVAGRLEGRLSDAITLTSISSYAHYKQDQTTDLDGTPYPGNVLIGIGYINSFSQEVRLNGISGSLNWIVGGSYAHDRTHQDDNFQFQDSTSAFAAGPATPIKALGLLADQHIETIAGFGNLNYELSSKVSAEGGFRYTQASLNYSGCSRDINGSANAGFTIVLNNLRTQNGLTPLPPIPQNACVTADSKITPGLVSGNLDEHNVSWRVGLNYKPDSRTLLYANVSKGYKAGSIPAISSTSALGIMPVSQESVLAYEIGAKTHPFGNLLEITGAGFYYLYTDKQLLGRVVATPNIFGAQSALVNVPKSDVWGAEVQATLRPVRALTLSGGLTYLKTRVLGDFVNYTILAVQQNFRGNPFPYTPRWQTTGEADYRIRLSGAINADLGATANYRSSTRSGFGDSPLLAIDAYTLIDLRAGVEAADQRWKLGLFVRNLTDAYYWTNVARTGDSVRRLTGQPRTYGLSYGLKF